MKNSIIEYSARIGRDSSLVQGAGGNVSWKDGDILYVKASGTWLADAEEKDIFVAVDLADLRTHYSQGRFDATPLVIGNSELRPSIETLLHAVMPQKVVVHTHPIDALSFLVKTNCTDLLHSAIGDAFGWAFVEYHKPGPELGAAVHRVISEASKAPDVIFLANHGVIVAGDELESIKEIYQSLQRRLACPSREFELPPLSGVPSILAEIGYVLPTDKSIQKLAFDPACQVIMLRHWAIYPDHVVFLGGQPNLYNSPEQLISMLDSPEASLPGYAIIPQYGVFIQDNLNENKLAMLKCFEEVLARLSEADDIRSLSEGDVLQLLDWEAEKYRSRIAK